MLYFYLSTLIGSNVKSHFWIPKLKAIDCSGGRTWQYEYTRRAYGRYAANIYTDYY